MARRRAKKATENIGHNAEEPLRKEVLDCVQLLNDVTSQIVAYELGAERVRRNRKVMEVLDPKNEEVVRLRTRTDIEGTCIGIMIGKDMPGLKAQQTYLIKRINEIYNLLKNGETESTSVTPYSPFPSSADPSSEHIASCGTQLSLWTL